MVGQVGLGPGRDESGDAAGMARFADVVVDPVERDERLGVQGGGEHPAGRHDLVVRGVQDEQGDGAQPSPAWRRGADGDDGTHTGQRGSRGEDGGPRRRMTDQQRRLAVLAPQRIRRLAQCKQVRVLGREGGGERNGPQIEGEQADPAGGERGR